MSSLITNNSSLARSRSLRAPTSSNSKPTSNAQPSAISPSYVSIFLTNLRLLDLDLRHDWPDITVLTFSTRDAQQNQKKRVQSVEWALFHLFALWDPEETRNKLQPFFPPLEQLQSLNLRAALFRCLDQAKKVGVLGRDTVLRKTMLDECKGERLEEVLAVFSNAVLKSVLERSSALGNSIARELAFENFSYTGERNILSAMILAHKASLSTHLRAKNDARARFTDFSGLLELNERRIARRHEQLKELITEQESHDKISSDESKTIQDIVQRNWSGNEQWLDTMLYGTSKSSGEGLLSTPFNEVWKHVEMGRISTIEEKDQTGLIEQLDARVKDQENRLARWQEFGRTVSQRATRSPAAKTTLGLSKENKINLGFDLHESIQVSRGDNAESIQCDDTPSGQYSQLIEKMKSDLANVGKPRALDIQDDLTNERALNSGRSSLTSSPVPEEGDIQQVVKTQQVEEAQQVEEDDEWASASDAEKSSVELTHNDSKSNSLTPPSESFQTKVSVPSNQPSAEFIDPSKPDKPEQQLEDDGRLRKRTSSTLSERKEQSPPLSARPLTPPREAVPAQNQPVDHETLLADQILNSITNASPSPKKRHTLSLAERTRLSMSRNSHSQYSDLHDEFEIADLRQLSLKPRHSIAPKTPTEDAEPEKHAELIERTRKSMAGFEAAQKKAQLERRRSIKDEKKKQRQSSYFPKVEEEAVTPDPVKMMEGDPDYESVFKSRPKIKTSPAVSPTRIWEDETED